MRFVPIKTQDQLDLQALHRVRDRLMQRRTSLINQLRTFLLERGVTVRAGVAQLKRRISELLETTEQAFSSRMAAVIQQPVEEWRQIERQLDQLNLEIKMVAEADPITCRRLLTVPGIGPLAATGIVAAVGNGAAFSKGREFATWLGLVPEQCSSGGKPKLLGISKRGNNYLRWLLIHGARSVMARVRRDRHQFGEWLTRLQLRAHRNVVRVALAGKLACIAWAVLAKESLTEAGQRKQCDFSVGVGKDAGCRQLEERCLVSHFPAPPLFFLSRFARRKEDGRTV